MVFKNKIDFKEKWNLSEPHEKLNFYGLVKLRYLAKQYRIKDYDKMNKSQLIDKLKMKVLPEDFPIILPPNYNTPKIFKKKESNDYSQYLLD